MRKQSDSLSQQFMDSVFTIDPCDPNSKREGGGEEEEFQVTSQHQSLPHLSLSSFSVCFFPKVPQCQAR